MVPSNRNRLVKECGIGLEGGELVELRHWANTPAPSPSFARMARAPLDSSSTFCKSLELLHPSSVSIAIGIASSPSRMPRTLARLRFRAPKPPRPLNLARTNPSHSRALERKVRNHVVRLSKPPTPLGLQVVVNPQWKKQPGKKTRKLAHKPHTLRDLVDPTHKARHGQIIYVFRNIKSNQVIYSLVELLDV